MITRNVLDSNGNTIGTIDFPDGTSEDIIASSLATHAYALPTPSSTQIVTSSIKAATLFGQNLIQQFAVANVLAGITQAGKTVAVADYLQTVAYYMNSGSLYAAINEINSLIADTSDAKAAVSPFVTNDILYSYLNKVQVYLSLPPTANPGSGS